MKEHIEQAARLVYGELAEVALEETFGTVTTPGHGAFEGCRIIRLEVGAEATPAEVERKLLRALRGLRPPAHSRAAEWALGKLGIRLGAGH